jgi:hypothetical protein
VFIVAGRSFIPREPALRATVPGGLMTLKEIVSTLIIDKLFLLEEDRDRKTSYLLVLNVILLKVPLSGSNLMLVK